MSSGSNFSCSECPRPAILFCTCTKSKILLCGSHVETHSQKPGAHVYGPAEARDIIATVSDFGAYSSKTKAKGELRNAIQSLKSRLTEEQSLFQTWFTQLWHDWAAYLETAFNQTRSEIEEIYSYLEADIDKISSELLDEDASAKGELSEEAMRVLQCSLHVSESISEFVNVSDEFATRVQIKCERKQPTVRGNLRKVLDVYKVFNCGCEECAQIVAAIVGAGDEGWRDRVRECGSCGEAVRMRMYGKRCTCGAILIE